MHGVLAFFFCTMFVFLLIKFAARKKFRLIMKMPSSISKVVWAGPGPAAHSR